MAVRVRDGHAVGVAEHVAARAYRVGAAGRAGDIAVLVCPLVAEGAEAVVVRHQSGVGGQGLAVVDITGDEDVGGRTVREGHGGRVTAVSPAVVQLEGVTASSRHGDCRTTRAPGVGLSAYGHRTLRRVVVGGHDDLGRLVAADSEGPVCRGAGDGDCQCG